MKSFFKKTSLLLVLSAVILGSSLTASADGKVTNKYISIMKPAHNAVFYKGETLSYQFSIVNPYSSYLCRPYLAIMTRNPAKVAIGAQGTYMSPGSSARPTGTLTTKDLAPGSYDLAVLGLPINPYTYMTVGGITAEAAGNTLIIRQLKAPSSLKVTAGKGQVTVSYKKATGAQKYWIYRSEKKSSGYKVVKKTSALKFVDKTVKKGKRYYYKVKSVRSLRGTVSSAFTTPKRSAAVK